MASQRISVILVTIIALATVYGTAPIDYEINALSVGSKDTGNADDHRLKNEFVPENYDVTITLKDDFATSKTFAGKVVITLTANSGPTNTQFINLNGVDITITGSVLKDADDATVVNDGDGKPSPNNNQIIQFKYKADLKKVTHKLTIDYTGIISEDMSGLYLANYIDETGAKKEILATQFQPTHARRLMPCFDEPEYKATFKITVEATTNFKAVLSNMVVAGATGKWAFPVTPKMSTYLLAIVATKYDLFKEDGPTNKYNSFSRFSGSLAEKTGAYSLQVTPGILNAMNEFTGVPFTTADMGIDKVDHVALPEFSAGAMENWGLVTYRESLVLYKDGQSTTKNKQRVCSIVAHELAHFWFGNLVTTAWWDNTWLNEGFATYFEYFAAHKVEKIFELDKQFVIEEQMRVMNADSMPSSKSLNSAAESPAAVRDKFSSISYSKGASIIRMLSHLAGDNNFKEVLKEYIDKGKAGKQTVIPEDLWKAAQNEGGITLPNKEVKEVMKEYLEKAGLPLIYVELVAGKVKITQKGRFLLSKGEEGKPVQRYYVPITYTTNEGNNVKFDFTKTKATKWLTTADDSSVDGPELKTADSAIFVNLQASAYARVNYDDALWERIKQTLNKERYGDVHIINRAQIVDDVLNLARAGVLGYAKALDIITEYLEKELSYYPWYVALNGFQYILRRLPADSQEAEKIKEYLQIVLADAKEDDPYATAHVEALKRSMMESWLCNLEIKKKQEGEENKKGKGCIHRMVELYKTHKESMSNVDPDKRGLAYCVGIREVATDAEWNNLFNNLYSTDRMPSETQLIISGLGCTKKKDLLNKYLDESIKTTSKILSQDADSVFSAVLAGNPENLPVALAFFKKNHADILTRYGGMNALEKVLSNLIDRFTKKDEIDEFRTFIDDKEERFKTEAEAMLKSAEANLEWTNNNKDAINKYVMQHIEKRKPVGPQDPGTNPPTTTPKGGSAGSIFANVLLIVCNAMIVLYYRQ